MKRPETEMKLESNPTSISFGRRIDFHTHILPKMDDGSKSVEMSQQMLDTLQAQGVSSVVLTPHFYPSRDNPAHFLEKRASQFDLLQSNLSNQEIRLFAGAEVHYFDGITAMQELDQMRIGNSEGLLIEMPMCAWSNRMVNDIAELNRQKGFRVIMAHIDRYLSFGNLPAIRQLASCGVMMQMNSSAFSGFFNARKALKLLNEGLVQLLGSDCHNITTRPPDIADAYVLIEKKCGAHAVKDILHHGQTLLGT